MKQNSSEKPSNDILNKLLDEEISRQLVETLKANPGISREEAVLIVQKKILQNRPECPPPDGRCPINNLPDELLAYIFQTGVAGQVEEDEDEEPDVPLNEDDGDDTWEDIDEEGGEGDEDDDDDNSDVDITYEDPEVEDEQRRTKRLEKTYRDDDFPFEILASHICQRWRCISIDTHTLWRRISIVGSLCVDRIKAYIERSGELPLIIDIDCIIPQEAISILEDEEDPLHQDLLQLLQGVGGEDLKRKFDFSFVTISELATVLDLLTPLVVRWKHFEFRCYEYSYILKLMQTLHELPSAPLLESFGVFVSDKFDDDTEFPHENKSAYLPFGGHAPKLKNVNLWGVHIEWEIAASEFLAGLDVLELSYHTQDVRPSYSTFKEIIRNSPDLKELVLTSSGPALPEGIIFDSEQGWGQEPLTISSVKTLCLEFHSVVYACALVQNLDFPNTTELILNFEESDYTPFVHTLAKPVRHRTYSILHQINSLKIRGLPCNAEGAEQMLLELKAVKKLALKVIGGDEMTIFQKLISPAAFRVFPSDSELAMVSEQPLLESFIPEDQLPKVFCPALEEITTVYVDSGLIKELVVAREAVGALLKRVRMGRSDDSLYDDIKWLETNVDDFGFHVPSDSEDEVEEDSEWTTDEEGDENGEDN